MDIVDRAKRIEMMRGVRRRDTGGELLVRDVLSKLRMRFATHVKALPGSPDIVLAQSRTCIFVHGCFWHRHQGCSRTTTPSSRAEFWLEKFAANRRRDRRATDALRRKGWRVYVVWECQAEKPEILARRLQRLKSMTPKARSNRSKSRVN